MSTKRTDEEVRDSIQRPRQPRLDDDTRASRDADRSPFVSARVDVARARELHRKGVGLTAIATLLGAKYADVYAVLAAPELPV